MKLLLFDNDQTLIVGDRPEDEGAAIAAGIPVRWAEERITPSP